MTRRRVFSRRASHDPDYLLIALVGLFVVFGLVMLSSASSVVSFKEFGSSYALAKHQLLFGILPGIALFIVLSNVDYHLYQRWALVFGVLAIALLAALFVPGVGKEVAGARRWLAVPGLFSFQPAEVVKLFLALALPAWFVRHQEMMRSMKHTFLPFLIFLAVVAGLIILQPDFGTMLIVVLMACAMYFVAGASWKHVGLLVGAGLACLLLMIQIAPYRVARITAFLHPENDPQGIGYHSQQALFAVGSGGWLGLGLGHSRQKFAYLPEVQSDSIFAIIAEELGFVATSVVVALFLFLVIRLLRVARRAPDLYGYVLASGVAAWIGFQVFINIGTMVKLLPLTGLPLPFISYGGTAMVATLAAMGIMVNISRQA